jgi:hypothetical protein
LWCLKFESRTLCLLSKCSTTRDITLPCPTDTPIPFYFSYFAVFHHFAGAGFGLGSSPVPTV